MGIDRTQRSDEASRIVPGKLEDEVNEELERLGASGRWIWSLFAISLLANLFNGFHISSYVFMAEMPENYWCDIPSLTAANWTRNQIRSIANNPKATDPCHIFAYDYAHLSTMPYDTALEYTNKHVPHPAEVSCLSASSAQMMYTKQGDSIVSEWNLVCENSVWRPFAQTIVSIGKCVSAVGVGILSDKYGRKTMFGWGVVVFTLGSVLAMLAPWYWAFLVGRALLGLACSGVYYTSLIMMTENVAPKHRYWMGVAFNISYPLGTFYLVLFAYFVHDWRNLQMALTIPTVVLFLYWYLFRESPRWLLSKGRVEKAYHVVFGRSCKNKGLVVDNRSHSNSQTILKDSSEKCGVFKEIAALYSTSRQRRIAFVCHFAYFAAAFSYYVTAINSDNLSASKFVYVLTTSGADFLAALVNIAFLRNLGRRWGGFTAFGLSGLCMLVLLGIPEGQTTWIVSTAVLGRFGVAIAYAIVTLYTAELFPTEIRNSAIGVSAMCSHVGSMAAPFVVDFTGRWAWFVPTTIVGCTLLLSAVLILLNPETHNQPLDDYFMLYRTRSQTRSFADTARSDQSLVKLASGLIYFHLLNTQNNKDFTLQMVVDKEQGLDTVRKIEDEVNEELDRVGQGGRWIWSLFLVSTLPNILNGFHISSYIFVGRMPDDYFCDIPSLVAANWTRSQIRSIANSPLETNPCHIYAYDYDRLSTMPYATVLEYIKQVPRPAEMSCLSASSARMSYTMEGDSIVPEWNLVCENSVWRTIVQTIVSVGKCVGALSVGVLSDRYGRKKMFGGGAVLYTAASVLVACTPWYWTFLVGRALLGLACSGLFYPSLIMMTENVAPKHRYWMGIAFNISYPLGMAYLALAAYFLHNWRDLQVALTIPSVVLFAFWFLFRESPRWLLSKGRVGEAYSVLFGQKYRTNTLEMRIKSEPTAAVKSDGIFKEIRILYGTSKQRRIAFICHFAYFASTFAYYVTAINADNLSANKVIYVLATGGVDALAIVVNLALLRNLGRRWGCMLSFGMSGLCMLALLAIPADQISCVVSVALLGRLGVTIVYAIVVLYTAELFPTEIRNTAVGASAMFSHIGSMLAPFVVDFTGRMAWFVPTTIVGCTLFLAAVLILFNPETQDQKLNDHVRYAEASETASK